MIEVERASISFMAGGRSVDALSPVDLAISAGEFVAFIGPSGCCKATLLNMLAGIVAPSGGRIVHDGRAVTGPNTTAGCMTQQKKSERARTGD